MICSARFSVDQHPHVPLTAHVLWDTAKPEDFLKEVQQAVRDLGYPADRAAATSRVFVQDVDCECRLISVGEALKFRSLSCSVEVHRVG